VVRVLEDPPLARMTLDFLRHHDIRAETRGDSPEGVRQLYKTFDIRIVVPRAQAQDALDALEAMTSDATDATPFRGPLPPPELGEEAPAAAIRNKRGLFAFVLAFLVPFGGGHFYAEHTAAGVVIAVAMLLFLIGSMLLRAPMLGTAMAFLIGFDALLSPWAVKRYRADAVLSPRSQRQLAGGIVVGALSGALLWSTIR
jgi:hypothetical protein